ncbi:MAG: oligopeptide:H+ symporter [Myxococcales bacterium]
MIARLKQHPIGFWFVFWGELAERASYYGMRTLLALYLVDVIGFSEHKGATVMQLFMAACYLLPLLGGTIADRWLGRYKTIVYFSLPYIAGHFILGATHVPLFIYGALGLLALGAGTIKPSTSPLMGLMYETQGKHDLLPEAFSIFYLAINIGSIFSQGLLPLVRDHFKPQGLSFAYQVSLATPTALMVLALLAFAAGKRFYPVESVTARPPKTREQRAAEWGTLARIGGVFVIIVFWWFVYDQQAAVWIYFARDHMNMRLWPLAWSFTPDQVQVVNPLFIVAFTPLFNWIWNRIAKKRGSIVPPTQRMLLGFVLTLLTAVVLTGCALAAAGGATVSVWWQVLAFALLTYAELCVSMTGLQFAYDQALPGTKSTVTAVFFLTVWAGDALGGFTANFYEHPLSPTSYFGIQVAVMAGCTVAFYFVARRFERQGNDAGTALPAAA